MAQYIKKVGLTPIRGDGQIVDSFNTVANTERNAPSLNAVEKRADNNLLFSSGFVSFKKSGQAVYGWVIEDDRDYSGDPAVFEAQKGLFMPAGYKGTVISPRFMSDDKGVYVNSVFSLTVLYRLGAVPSLTTPASVGTIEAINESEDHKTATFDSALKVTVYGIETDGSLKMFVENVSENPLYIDSVKYELGATATAFEPIGKDNGINDAIEAVEPAQVDRNLLIGGDFHSFRVSPAGWQVYNLVNEGSHAEPAFSAFVGYLFPNTCVARLNSPRFSGSVYTSDPDRYFTISIIYRKGAYTTPYTVVKRGIKWYGEENIILYNEGGVTIRIRGLLGYSLNLTIENISTQDFYIQAINLEEGFGSDEIYRRYDAISRSISTEYSIDDVKDHSGVYWYHEEGTNLVKTISGSISSISNKILSVFNTLNEGLKAVTNKWVGFKVQPTDTTGYYNWSFVTVMFNLSSTNYGVAYIMSENRSGETSPMMIGQLWEGVWHWNKVMEQRDVTEEEHSATFSTSGSVRNGEVLIDISKSGYRPIGIIQIYGDGVSTLSISSYRIKNENEAVVGYYNLSTGSVSVTMKIVVLYRRKI